MSNVAEHAGKKLQHCKNITVVLHDIIPGHPLIHWIRFMLMTDSLPVIMLTHTHTPEGMPLSSREETRQPRKENPPAGVMSS